MECVGLEDYRPMHKTLALSFAALLTASLFWAASSAQADPRVTQVNSRFADQTGRIQRGKGKHKMTPAQQTRANEAVYRMVNEQQNMRSRHHGKLTERDQRSLNRQLDRNSRQINRDKGN
jgi:hypothetical protein